MRNLEDGYIFRQAVSYHPHFENDEGYRREMDRHLAQSLALHIAHMKAVSIKKPYQHERRLEIVAATIDEFWELVYREARKLVSTAPDFMKEQK